MPIEFRCPGCQRRLRVPDGAEGWLAQCPLCGQQTPIPFRWSAERPSSSGEETPYSPTWTDPRWLERPSAPPEPFPPEPSSGMATGDEFFPPPAPTGPFPAEPFPTQMEQTRQGAGSATAGSLTGTWDWHRHYASQRLSTPANWADRPLDDCLRHGANEFGFGGVGDGRPGAAAPSTSPGAWPP
jgi:hypothetical protein